MSAPAFEPRFYERAAQRHLAQLAGGSVFANVAWGLTGAPERRPELDALWWRGGRAVPAEVKAHPVGHAAAEEILGKYRRLGFRELVVVAPACTGAGAATLAGSAAPRVEVLAFTPDLEAVRAFYAGAWDAGVPGWVHQSLASGAHHVRFMLTSPTDAGHLVLGQPRSRVYTTAAISRAAARLPAPPARVLWTPQRFTIPRDVIARRSRLTALGGFLPVDIDGDRLHRANHACQVGVDEPCCPHCARHAAREYTRLVAALPGAPWVDVLSSGGRGLHAYLDLGEDGEGWRPLLLDAARTHGLRIDTAVSASPRATVAFPGSLNAGTGQPVTPVQPTPRPRPRPRPRPQAGAKARAEAAPC